MLAVVEGIPTDRDANLRLLEVGKVGSNSSEELDPPLRTNLSVEDLQPARNRTYAITVTPDNRFWARVHRVKIIREHPPDYSNELTATLTDLGIETETQGGLLARTFDLALSEAVRMPASELKNHTLSVNGGVLGKVTRVDGSVRYVNGRWVKYTDRWQIRVIVKQGGTLTVAGNRACQLDGALCTDDGRQLDGTPSVPFDGAPQLKVSIEGPAEGGDEDDGRLDFEVSLSRGPQKLVRVRFRIIDSGANAGTATPNVDYLPADYTLEFGPGDPTTMTVPVGLYDDNIDDTGETVTVEISDARMILNRNGRSRAVAIAAPRRASGTIYNSDPLPREWIARFGRTVADQVLDAVDARLRAARSAGVEVGLGGRRIAVAPHAAGSRSGGNSSGRGSRLRRGFDFAVRRYGGDPGAGAAQGDGGMAERSNAGRGRVTPRIAVDDPARAVAGLVLFSLAAETKGDGFAALWGRMAQMRFAGREGTLGVDGDVTTGLLGADYALGRWTTGLVVSHSTGEGG